MADSDQFIALLRLLIDRGCDPNDENGWGRSALQNYDGPAAAFSWLIAQTINDGGIPAGSDPLWRIGFSASKPDLVRAGLPESTVTFTAAQERTKRGETILHLSARMWSWRRSKAYYDDWSAKQVPEWESLIREAIGVGADLHAQTHRGRTPFLELLDAFRYELLSFKMKRLLTKTLHAWLTLLKEEGVDLKRYVEVETKLWDPEMLRLIGILEMHLNPRGWVKVVWETGVVERPSKSYDPALDIFGEDLPFRPVYYRYRTVTVRRFLQLGGDYGERDRPEESPDYPSDSDDDFDSELDTDLESDSDEDSELPSDVPGSWVN